MKKEKSDIFAKIKRQSKQQKKNYTIRIDEEVGEAFKRLCEKEGVAMSQVIEEFFKEQLAVLKK